MTQRRGTNGDDRRVWRLREPRPSRSPSTYADPVSQEERVAAARARVVADRKRGVQTEDWILELAGQGRQPA